MEARAGRDTNRRDCSLQPQHFGRRSSGNVASSEESSPRHLCALVLACKQAGQPKALPAPSRSAQGSLGFRTQALSFSRWTSKRIKIILIIKKSF